MRPGDHERVVLFGWLMFGLMVGYVIVAVLARGCATACGITPLYQ